MYGKMELFGAMAMGRPIRLYDGSFNVFMTGRIYKIALETGVPREQQPQRFIVTLHVDECKEHKLCVGTMHDVYVKTVD